MEHRSHRTWLDRAGVFLFVTGLVVAIAAIVVSRSHAMERTCWVCQSCGARKEATRCMKIPLGASSTTPDYDAWVARTVPTHAEHRWVYSHTDTSGWHDGELVCAEPEYPHYLPELYAKRSADPRVAELLIDCIREFESGAVDPTQLWERARALDQEPTSPAAPERSERN